MKIEHNLEISKHLDPVFETMNLLFESYNIEDLKKETITQLDNLGINGESFYEKNLKVIENYTQTFNRYRVDHKDRPFFCDTKSSNFYLFMMLLTINHPHWFSEINTISENEIREALYNIIKEYLELTIEEQKLSSSYTTEEIVMFLNTCDLDEGSKWKLMRVFLTPKPLITSWLNMISDNIAAFQRAVKENEQVINKLLQAFDKSIYKQKNLPYEKLLEKEVDKVVIYPALITPLGIVNSKTKIHYGLLVDFLPLTIDGSNDIREYLLIRLKALADNSKLQLLMLLKQSPKYNLELAENLGITAATTSHHMNVLLASGMVRIEKMNGKVYYHLDKDNIKEFVQQLETYLL